MILGDLVKAFSSANGCFPDLSEVTNGNFRQLLDDSNLYLDHYEVQNLNKLFEEAINDKKNEKALKDFCIRAGFLSLFKDSGVLKLIARERKSESKGVGAPTSWRP